MKIKIKGTNKVKDITPNEWAVIEKNGQTSEYEIVERNTVWAAPINTEGTIVESHKREFELDHWHNLVDLGSKNKWKRIDSEKTDETETIEPEKGVSNYKETKKNTIPDKSLEISELQLELTQVQIEKARAETNLTIEKTKDLKRKIAYFIAGVVIGNIDTILKLLKVIDQ